MWRRSTKGTNPIFTCTEPRFLAVVLASLLLAGGATAKPSHAIFSQSADQASDQQSDPSKPDSQGPAISMDKPRQDSDQPADGDNADGAGKSGGSDKSDGSDNPNKSDKNASAATVKLRIEVTNNFDKPVSNASVYVRFPEAGGFLHRDKLAELDLKTNQDGSVKVPPIPQGKILIQIIATGWHTYGKWYDLDKDEELVKIKLAPPPHWY